MNGWSDMAGVIAGQLYKAQYATSYEKPLIVTMEFLAVGIVEYFSFE